VCCWIAGGHERYLVVPLGGSRKLGAQGVRFGNRLDGVASRGSGVGASAGSGQGLTGSGGGGGWKGG